MPQVAAVVVAAGQGLRAGGDMPKQFREIGGASLLRRSLLGFASVPAVSALQPVVRKDDIDLVREHTRDIRILPPVFLSRMSAPGLEASFARPISSWSMTLPTALRQRRPDRARDCGRPEKTGAAIPALPVTDTVKRLDAGRHHRNDPRPQPHPPGANAASLRLSTALLDAHRRAAEQGR